MFGDPTFLLGGGRREGEREGEAVRVGKEEGRGPEEGEITREEWAGG